MGKMVFAGAMSHVLDPDYYDAACGPVGRRKVEDVMEAIRQMGARLAARSPDALIVVADDHLNAFSFNAVPALCVRVGTAELRFRAAHCPSGGREPVERGDHRHRWSLALSGAPRGSSGGIGHGLRSQDPPLARAWRARAALSPQRRRAAQER